MARRSCPDCTVGAGALILCAAGILLLPLRWLLALLLAGTVHELFHMAALCLLNVPIHTVHIGFRGAYISTAPMSPRQEILASAAGPAGSLVLILFLRFFPELALCGLVQGLYNLLTLYPGDGGRIQRCILRPAFRKIPCNASHLAVQ
jgi:Zn-dependent protease